MNCRSAQNQILTDRDTSPGAAVAAELAEHLAGCAGCRTMQLQLTAVTAAWRESDANVPSPDPRQEWHAVRRRLRSGAAPGTARRRRTVRGWGFALACGAAALAVTLWVGRASFTEQVVEPGNAALVATAAPMEDWEAHFAYSPRAEFVETDNEDASPFIYLDEESGWLVVWASAPPPERASI